MAVLNFDTEYAAASDKPAFSNSFEGECWMAAWCENCANDTEEDCQLILIAMLGRTPHPWVQVEELSLQQRYHCRHFVPRDVKETHEP